MEQRCEEVLIYTDHHACEALMDGHRLKTPRSHGTQTARKKYKDRVSNADSISRQDFKDDHHQQSPPQKCVSLAKTGSGLAGGVVGWRLASRRRRNLQRNCVYGVSREH